MKARTLIPGLLLLLSWTSCKLPTRISYQNLSFIYREESKPIHPIFTVFHENDSSTVVHYKIRSSELLYSKRGQDDRFTAHLAFRCILYNSFEYEDILDSVTHYADYTGDNSVEQLISGSFPVKSPRGMDCLLEVRTMDLNRKEYTLNYLPIRKKNVHNAQYFRLSRGDDGLPLARNHTALNELLTIQAPVSGQKTLFVRYYRRDFPLPPPPFSLNTTKPFDYTADSTYTVTLDDNYSIRLSVNRIGFYQFQVDSTSREGLSLFAFGDDFPKVTTTEGLVQPLRYLTTQQEFEKIMAAGNRREAADEFWRSSGGSDERTRDLIRKYYTRVEDANAYFTSYLEGWRTDRGLVYVIFGPPNVIYKTSNSESWIYGEEHNALSLQFSFAKVNNPFSENDYSLNRSPIYKNSWYRAVDTWRQGRVY